MKLLSQRAKLGVVAAATAMASLAGVGLADAAPGHTTQPQSGTASYLGGRAPTAEAETVEVPVQGNGGITLAKDLLTRPAPGKGGPPPAAGNTGEMSVRGGYQWFPGRVTGATGVRLRSSAPSGSTLAYLPQYGHVWLWCQLPAGGAWWFRVALNTSRGWVYGYSSTQFVYPSPDRAIPRC
ncbi:hypothetical protein ACIQUM_36465 [Amycolatopsis azurea]|uniref:hypothetical protein n=1 Tax=Amycolatopsis azurea TaxID=36819 RepID=UPI003816D311